MKGRELIDAATAAKERTWYLDHSHGLTTQEISTKHGVAERRIRAGIRRARGNNPSAPGETAGPYIRPPRLEPLFPVRPLVPRSTCPHGRRVRRFSVFCCMICHRSGMDWHPGLRRNRRFDPKPEAKQSALPPPKKTLETRRQRRQRLFGSSTVTTTEPAT